MKQYPLFKDEGVIWRISAKWVTHPYECQLSGIQKRCGARCCSTKSYWPPSAFEHINKERGCHDTWVPNGIGVKNELYACGYLGPSGCILDWKDKPITCILHPLKLNANDKLVCSNWVTKHMGTCRGNFGCGPLLIDALKPNLVFLFGEKQYDRVRQDVVSGVDSHVIVPYWVWDGYIKETELAKLNFIPEPRSNVK